MVTTHSETVGALIRERRKRKGWSQTILGDRVGMSAATIHRMEHGERIPTDQDAEMIVTALGIERESFLEACHAARLAQPAKPQAPKSAYQQVWDMAHPANYAGRVWIQVYPTPQNRDLPHEFQLRWGVWQRKGTLYFTPDQDYVYLTHYKHNDGQGLPLFLTLSQPCYVVFGVGKAPDDAPTVDINFNWQRVEPPPPRQMWRFVRSYIRQFFEILLLR